MKNHFLQAQIKQLEEQCKVIFNEDQIHYLKHGNHRGTQWSNETIQKSLKLYMSCGTKGYEELRKQGYPLPSIRTLQYKIQNFKFEAGVFEDILNLLALKVASFNSQEKHACLLLDEMAIKPGLQYDNSTKTVVGRPTMKLSGNKDSSQTLATHALVFMLAGMNSRWKQTIGYEYTAASYSADEVLKKLFYIIRRSHDIGVRVKTIISDMGPLNRSFWRLLNISANRHEKIKNCCPHPVDENKKLYIMPDPVHVFKCVATSLIRNKQFTISNKIKQLYKLPSEIVDISAIRHVYELDCLQEIKVAPRLKEFMFQPGHFEKMNVNTAYSLFHHDTAAAITYFISKGRVNQEFETTAWFCRMLFKWFSLITSRSCKLGLSEHNPSVYQETITFLKHFIEITCELKVGVEWKPFQSGILLATQTALDLQEEYLQTHSFRFLLLGRLTQDAIENLFSVVRSRSPVPGPRDFKVALRLITLSQYECQIVHGNYFIDNREHLISYCQQHRNDLKDESTDAVIFPDFENFNMEEVNTVLTEHVRQSLYYLLGSMLFSLKKTTCNNCIENMVYNSDNINEVSQLTQLKSYKENILTYPKMAVFNYILNAEMYFRKFRENLLNNVNHHDDVANAFILQNNFDMDICHKGTVDKLIKLFFRTRFFFCAKDL